MIYHLEGSIAQIGDDYLVIDIVGVGYQVFVPSGLLSSRGQGEIVKLYTVHYVREDAQLLFGFSALEDRQFFLLLTSVSGMGPKGAIKALSHFTAEQLCAAILSEDVFLLTQISGVGKKLAERLVIELKDKVEKLGAGIPVSSGGSSARVSAVFLADLSMALRSLGYSSDEVKKAISRSEGLKDGMTLEEGIKVLLKQLL